MSHVVEKDREVIPGGLEKRELDGSPARGDGGAVARTDHERKRFVREKEISVVAAMLISSGAGDPYFRTELGVKSESNSLTEHSVRARQDVELLFFDASRGGNR